MLILEGRGKVDAVVFADVTDGLWREFLGLATDTHGIEDVTTGREVATEGSGTDIRQSGEFALADETVLIVEVNHIVRGV